MKFQLPDFASVRILVAGDLMLDRYWSGETSRISPEAPVPVVRVTSSDERPGGAGNVALNIAALGAESAVLGVVGEDRDGQVLQQQLEAHSGLSCDLARAPNYPTVTKLRVLSRHQQLIRLDFEEPVCHADLPSLGSAFERNLGQADVVILSDYGKGALSDSRQLIARARAAGKPVLVDPKQRDFSHYHGATLVTPNRAEFEAVVGPCLSDTDFVVKGEALMVQHDLAALLITRSEHGMTLLQRGEEPLHIPALARDVFDVTGAGDTVIATFAVALGAGVPMTRAARLANVAAGIVVGKLGAETVSVPELRRALYAMTDNQRGVFDEATLLERVEDARAHGETIVMTNGCFDILHAGHVAYLEQAARLGDRLIVAVNSDESVKRLKGEERPIVPLEQRMAVLSGLASVDWVVPFVEETPERLICRLLPDILVKGGDYQPHEIAGGSCVTANGGEVVVLEFKDGCSTTRIIRAITQSS